MSLRNRGSLAEAELFNRGLYHGLYENQTLSAQERPSCFRTDAVYDAVGGKHNLLHYNYGTAGGFVDDGFG